MFGAFESLALIHAKIFHFTFFFNSLPLQTANVVFTFSGKGFAGRREDGIFVLFIVFCFCFDPWDANMTVTMDRLVRRHVRDVYLSASV